MIDERSFIILPPLGVSLGISYKTWLNPGCSLVGFFPVNRNLSALLLPNMSPTIGTGVGVEDCSVKIQIRE